MKKQLIVVLSFLIWVMPGNAQVNIPQDKRDDCGSGINYYKQLKVDPKFRANVARIETITKQFIERRNKNIMNEDRLL